MSQNLPNMLEGTIAKLKDIMQANTVVGTPIDGGDGLTIIPVSKIMVGMAGGGSDFVSKNPNSGENPFGGGVGTGVNMTPVAFLVIKDGNVRVLPVNAPANSTADRIVELVPETVDKISTLFEKKKNKE